MNLSSTALALLLLRLFSPCIDIDVPHTEIGRRHRRNPTPLIKNKDQQTSLEKNSITSALLQDSTQQLSLPHGSTDIFVGVCTVASASFTTKKKECPHLSQTNDNGQIDSFPSGDYLTFHAPSVGTLYSNALEKTKEINLILKHHNELYIPDNPFANQIKPNKLLMTRRRGAGTYFIDNKFGRSTDLSRRYDELSVTVSTARRSNVASSTGIVTSYFDGFPGSLLSNLSENLQSIFESVNVSFEGHDSLRSFLSGASFNDVMSWEFRSGGMSIYFALCMQFALAPQATPGDELLGGIGPKNRLKKHLFLNQIESSQQLNCPEHTDGEVHEHFHWGFFSDFVSAADGRVEEDLRTSFMDMIEDVTGRSLSTLTFTQHPHSVSWQPGLEFFSTQMLNERLQYSANTVVRSVVNHETFANLSDDERHDIVYFFGEEIGCDELVVKVLDQDRMSDIASKAFDFCRKDDQEAFRSVTEILYDTFAGVRNSEVEGFWKNPFQRPTNRESGSYNPRGTYDENDREEARRNNLVSIRKMKEETDSCVDPSNVRYTFMDTNNEAYTSVSYDLELVLEQNKFIKMHVFSQVKTFVYQTLVESSEGECCIGIIFLHSPLHRALESRPPWERTAFSPDEWKEQSEAAVSSHYLHTISLTFRDVSRRFETPKQMTGTILPAYCLRAYVSMRIHHGDLRVGTLLAKALFLGRNGNQLLDSSLLRVNALNKFCSRNGDKKPYTSFSFRDRLLSFISAASESQDAIVNEVHDKILEQGQDKDVHLTKLKDDYFKDGSSFMSALIAKFDEDSEQKQTQRVKKRRQNFSQCLSRFQQ